MVSRYSLYSSHDIRGHRQKYWGHSTQLWNSSFVLICSYFKISSLAYLESLVLLIKCCKIYVVYNIVNTCYSSEYFVTMHWRFSLIIKSTSPYENTRIHYLIIVVNLLHVPVNFCGRLQWGVFTMDILYITKTAKSVYKYKILSFKYVIQIYVKYIKYR